MLLLSGTPMSAQLIKRSTISSSSFVVNFVTSPTGLVPGCLRCLRTVSWEIPVCLAAALSVHPSFEAASHAIVTAGIWVLTTFFFGGFSFRWRVDFDRPYLAAALVTLSPSFTAWHAASRRGARYRQSEYNQRLISSVVSFLFGWPWFFCIPIM